MTGDGKLRSDWNQALLADVVAPLYASLVSFVSRYFTQKPLPLGFYYSLFPVPEATQK